MIILQSAYEITLRRSIPGHPGCLALRGKLAPPQICEAIMAPVVKTLETLIFASRWIQAPLYLGLIVAQIIYCLSLIHI